jgi:hypothetical protein
VKEIKYGKVGICGHPQINHALSLIEDGFVYIVDDDNVVHPEFWAILRTLDPDLIYTWDQNRIREGNIMKGGRIEFGAIDTSQFIVPRRYIGDIRWDDYKRGGDFMFISEIHKRYPESFKYINKVACYHNFLKKKVAVCFWGLTRSLKCTLPSIQRNLLGPLRNAKMDVDVFLHTYTMNGLYSNPWSKETNVKLDTTEYKLLKPKECIVENQNVIGKRIGFKKYRTHGNPWGNMINPTFEILDNSILALWSLKKVTSLWLKHQERYTHVMYCRPDIYYEQPLDVEWFTNDNTVRIPDFDRYGGRLSNGKFKANDRFAIGRPEQMVVYGSRFDDALEYSKKYLLHSEGYLADILFKNKMKVEFIKFHFTRVRTGCKKDAHDVKLSKKLKWKTRKLRHTRRSYTLKNRH